MSFLETLRNAREIAKTKIKESTELNKIVADNIIEENNIVIDDVKEDLTEQQPDNHDDNIMPISLGNAIIKQSKESVVKYKNLKKGTGGALRIARAIDKHHITVQQIQKAFKIQERYNDKRADWHIVGSYAMSHLKTLLNEGMTLQEALNTTYEGK